MRVFGLNIPKAVSAVRALELSKEARQRLRVLEWYRAHGENGRLACRHFGISPDTFHRWKERFEQGGSGCLEDGSRIAFVRSHTIHVMNADGSGLTDLTDNPAIDGAPAWSPAP